MSQAAEEVLVQPEHDHYHESDMRDDTGFVWTPNRCAAITEGEDSSPCTPDDASWYPYANVQ